MYNVEHDYPSGEHQEFGSCGAMSFTAVRKKPSITKIF